MTTALDKVKQLKAELEAAEKAAAGEIAANKAIVIDEVITHMQENDVSLAEISVRMRVAGSKYSSGTDTWSGKGKQPKWLATKIAAGSKLDNFLTVKPQASAE